MIGIKLSSISRADSSSDTRYSVHSYQCTLWTAVLDLQSVFYTIGKLLLVDCKMSLVYGASASERQEMKEQYSRHGSITFCQLQLNYNYIKLNRLQLQLQLQAITVTCTEMNFWSSENRFFGLRATLRKAKCIRKNNYYYKTLNTTRHLSTPCFKKNIHSYYWL